MEESLRPGDRLTVIGYQ